MRMKPKLFSRPTIGHPLAKGLVSYWLMNEGEGTIVQDLSGNGNIGNIGANSWIASKHGSAVNCTDSSIAISTKSSIHNLSVDYTLLAFYKRTASGAKRVFNKYVASGTGRAFYVDEAATSISYFSSPTGLYDAAYLHAITVPTVAVGERRHLVLSKRGANVNVYSNGLYISTTTVDNSYINTSSLTICSASLISEYVYIWNRALTANEVAKLYLDPFCMFEEDM